MPKITIIIEDDKPAGPRIVPLAPHGCPNGGPCYCTGRCIRPLAPYVGDIPGVTDHQVWC